MVKGKVARPVPSFQMGLSIETSQGGAGGFRRGGGGYKINLGRGVNFLPCMKLEFYQLFLCIALRIPTAHDFRISADT